MAAYNPAYANRSYRLIINAPFAWQSVRLYVLNNSATLPFIIGALKVSASDSLNTSGPTNGAWVQATQNNSTRIVVPPCKVIDEPVPFFTTDIPVASIARADGGTKKICFISTPTSRTTFRRLPGQFQAQH